MTDQPRKSLRLELAPSERPGKIAFHAIRWSLLVALALLTYLLFPVARGFEMPAVNEVASRQIIAEFQFDVPKTQDEIDRELVQLEATVLPVYEVHEEIVDSAITAADTVFALLDSATTAEELIEAARGAGITFTSEQAEYLVVDGRREAYQHAVRAMLRTHLTRGVPRQDFTQTERKSRIAVRRGESLIYTPVDSVFTFERFWESRVTRHPDPMTPQGDQVFFSLLNAVFRPTLIAQEEETEALLQEVRATVSSVRETVQENQLIVEANRIVTPETYRRLVAYQDASIQRGRTEGNLSATVGQVLVNALLLSLFWVLLMLYLPNRYGSLRTMLALTLVFAVVIAGAAANVRFLPGERPELIPIPYAAMMVSVLIGGRLAMVTAMVLAVLLGSQAVFGGVNALFVAVMGGVAAGLSVRSIRRRNHLLASVGIVAFAYFMAALTVKLRLDLPYAELGTTAVAGMANAMVSAALVILTLPLFEWMTGATTELTLLELSDPQRPLLRRLATETPGTYAHSLALANLCEAASNAVGANGLLTRVGCYYHDIGKLKKPQFFVENQVPGVNPHDKLKPEVSATMIRNHVREGIALANENRLPDAVKAFISEHHGTMKITYFLDRARSKNGAEEVNEEEFSYPGPRPRSVETAVVMLGDGVEAAVRVLEDPTQQKVRDAIDHLMRQRIESGQLDKAPITLSQLARIREEFVRVLEGVHHNRIDYPASSGGLSSDWDASTAS
jgi:putative nucleotidyltransferase with HDIG domain